MKSADDYGYAQYVEELKDQLLKHRYALKALYDMAYAQALKERDEARSELRKVKRGMTEFNERTWWEFLGWRGAEGFRQRCPSCGSDDPAVRDDVIFNEFQAGDQTAREYEPCIDPYHSPASEECNCGHGGVPAQLHIPGCPIRDYE